MNFNVVVTFGTGEVSIRLVNLRFISFVAKTWQVKSAIKEFRSPAYPNFIGATAVSQIDAKSKTPQIVLLARINDVILEKYDRWIVLLRNINKTTDLSSCRVTLLLTIAVFKKVCDRLVVFMDK